MRIIAFLVIVALVFSSCKSNKSVVNKGVVKSVSANKIIKRHNATSFDAETLDAKLRVSYSDTKKGKRTRYTFTVRLRMQKDSVIWMKGTYKILSAFRIKITPTKFSYYSPIEKRYFEGDYSLLEKMLGTKVTFTQLQNLLLGQSILDLKDQKYLAEVEGRAHKLTPKKQKDLYSIFFLFNPRNFKLQKQSLEVDETKQRLRIDYDNYVSLENQLIPRKIVLNSYKGDDYTFIDISFRSLTINKEISTPYNIPEGYKRIKL
tara:strand:+ start:4839 stop:5621 length:783 start_codon:yes stop_codon:yes gene_type:complete